jgi:hypothetical protein
MESVVTDALADAGTLIVEWTALQDYDAFDSGQRGFVSVANSAASLLSFNATEGGLTSEDGTNTETLASINWSEDDAIISVVRWDKDLDGGSGYLHLLNKLNAVWDLNAGNESPFDGTFTLGTDFWLHYTNELSAYISGVYMYNIYLSDTDIENEIWSGGARRGLMRLGMQLK